MAGREERFRYQEIAGELRAGILRGEYRQKGRLPSERVLGERFGVQRNTVRQALALLEREGHISTEGKRGSFLRASGGPSRDAVLLSLPEGTSPHLAHLAEGVARAARAAGFRVRRTENHHAEGAVLDPIPDPAALPADAAGMILWPQNPTDEGAVARLNAALPLVLVDRRVPGVHADGVRFDDVAGGRAVTEHLLEQGHRRVGFLTDDVFAETVQHRWQGYAAAHEGAGVPLDPSLSLFLNGIHEPFFSVVLRHLLGGAGAPTGIVCSNDIVALRLLHFLQSEGLRVPDDVAVTGYGNTMPDYLQAVALTTMDQAFAQLGAMATEILLGRRGGFGGGGFGSGETRAPRDATIPVTLIVRKSSVGGRGAAHASGASLNGG